MRSHFWTLLIAKRPFFYVILNASLLPFHHHVTLSTFSHFLTCPPHYPSVFLLVLSQWRIDICSGHPALNLKHRVSAHSSSPINLYFSLPPVFLVSFYHFSFRHISLWLCATPLWFQSSNHMVPWHIDSHRSYSLFLIPTTVQPRHVTCYRIHLLVPQDLLISSY